MIEPVKLVIAIPTAGMVPMGFAYSLATMLSWVGANGIPSLPETPLEIKLDVVESSNWITNREQLVKRALDSGMSHLMFLDDDMTWQPEIISVMLGRRHPVVCTNYLIKTEPPKDFVAVGLDGNRVPTREESCGLQAIQYSGFGVSIFETRVFRAIEQPWFLPKFVPEDSSYTTEDMPLYEKIRAAGFQVYLDQDASKLVSHIGRRGWNWRQANG